MVYILCCFIMGHCIRYNNYEKTIMEIHNGRTESMSLMSLIVNKEPTGLEWIEGGILWDIANYKIAGIPTAEQLLLLTQDKDLKKAINMGIENIALPHIEKIRNFLIKQGLQAPNMPDRRLKGDNTESYQKSNILTDADIANALREVYRLGLNIEIQGIAKGTRADVSTTIKEILNDDIDGDINLVKLCYIKNWAFMTPQLPSQSPQ